MKIKQIITENIHHDDIPDLEDVGEPVESIMDAEQRLANGDRIFAFHEMDEEPHEIRNVGDLRGYTYDQLLAVPAGMFEAANAAQQAAIAVNMKRAHKKPKEVDEDSDPCWTGYKQVGMKKKGGRKVPNCVPAEGVEEGKTGPGLWANIHAKKERIKRGSGERMRKPGSRGAPTDANFRAAKKTKDVTEQFDPATQMMWINQVSELAQAVSQLSPEELVKLNDAYQSFYRIAGGATAGASAVGIGGMFYSLMKDTLNAAKRKARVDTEEILQLKRQIISIHKMLKRVKSEKAVAKYQAMLKQAFDVLGELEARRDNQVAETRESAPKVPQKRQRKEKPLDYEKLAAVFNRLLPDRNITKALNHHLQNQKGKDDQDVTESGPFNYGAKKPRKGTEKDRIAQANKKYRDNKQVTEPTDQMVGNARLTKDDQGVSEGKNSHWDDDRSIDPRTGKPYIKFGPKGPTTDDDPERQMHSDTPPTYIYPGYKTAKAYADKSGQKVVRGGVSKWKVVPKDDSAEEVFSESFNLEEELQKLDEKSPAWQKKSGKNKNGGLNKKGVASYRREHPGSKLQTAVTTKPSKLKPGSKPAKRRKSFCARMSGMKGPMKDEHGKPTRKALALRKWNC